MKKTLYALSSVLLLSVSSFAQNTELINGRLRATIGSQGQTTFVNPGHSFLDVMEDGEWVSLILEAGLLIGGQDPNGELVLYSTQGADLEAGIRDLGVEISQPWRVTGEQILAHLADYNDNGVVDNPIFEIFAWPGTGSASSEEYNGFPLWDDQNIFQMSGFWDSVSNGSYFPSQGDYPIVSIRGCLDAEPRTIPEEMIFIPILLRDDNGQLVFEVQLTAFRFGCEEMGSAIGNSLFFHYKILNVSGMQFDNVYVGYWADGDLGCYRDDYLGVFDDRKAVYFYNARAEDSFCELSDDNRFSGPPAAFAIDILRGPLDQTGTEIPLSNVMPIYNGSVIQSVPPATTDPATIMEYYNYLSGRWRDGSPLVDQGIGYGGEGEQVAFPFTGDPAANTGWTEIGEDNPIADRRAIMSSGPFTLLPGAINEFIFSLTFSQEPDLDHLQQITELRSKIDTVQAFFDSCFDLSGMMPGVCTPLLTGTEDELIPTNNQLLLYPNPASNQVNISFPVNESGTLAVFSADGRMLLQKRTLSDRITLDLQDWPKGLYVVRWKGEYELRFNKLLVD